MAATDVFTEEDRRGVVSRNAHRTGGERRVDREQIHSGRLARESGIAKRSGFLDALNFGDEVAKQILDAVLERGGR